MSLYRLCYRHNNQISVVIEQGLIGISRMNPELAWMVAIFWIGRKPRCEVSMAPAFQTIRTALEGLIWRFSMT